jgi:hypothetical protein
VIWEGRDHGGRPRAEDRVLRSALAEVVGRLRPGARLHRVLRRPLARASSWWMEELRIFLDEGPPLDVVFKDLGHEAPGSRARRTKPSRVLDPAREPWAYRSILEPLDMGTPRCFGAVSGHGAGPSWLFLESVQGPPLWETGEGDVWREAARWLARFHARAARVGGFRGPALLHKPRLHHGWRRRALALARERMRRGGRPGTAARARLAVLSEIAEVHAAVAEALPNLSRGLIHGEFYPSNILVEGGGIPRIRPVDWEMAGLGPHLLDLAALTAGQLEEYRRAELAEAYRGQAMEEGLPLPEAARFRRELVMCRLLLAMQWLGWGRDWTPPAEHDNDWLEEARSCALDLTA